VVAPRLAPVIVPVVVAGVSMTAVAAAHLGGTSSATFAGAAALLAAATLAETFPVPIEGVTAGATSLATIFIVAAGALYSWPLATLVGALTMLFVEALHRKPLAQFAYNMSLYALAGAAAGGVATIGSGRYVTCLGGSAAFYVIDIGLLAAVIARVKGERYVPLVRSFVTSTCTPFAVMAATTTILVELRTHSPFFPLLLAPPVIAIAAYQRSLHAAMERQRELDRLKEEFVAVVSHELRTPLSSVYGGIETLQRDSLAPAVRERLFGMVRQEAARLARLVDDVLWASRLDGSDTATAPFGFETSALVAEAAASFADLSENVHMVTSTSPEPPPTLGHREHVQRVLSNLLENALKYSPDGGTVEVSAGPVDDRVRYTVRDEGIGVPETERERIFEKFTRLDPQMTRGISGTGLGLYICRQLVEQMGGRIWAEDNHGKGSTFSFELPIAADHGKGQRLR
jgi:signal transduction histidine kinase